VEVEVEGTKINNMRIGCVIDFDWQIYREREGVRVRMTDINK